MIHELVVEVGKFLVAQKCPVKVLDGPERTQTASFGRERIVIEHDEAGDKFSSVIGTHRNPTHRMTRGIGVKVTIYAQSAASGAIEWEHRRRAEHILDLVLVALDLAICTRRNRWSQSGGKFITPPGLKDAEIPGGAVYELTASVDRAVMAQTWKGDAQPQAMLGGVPGASAPAGLTGTPALTFAAGPLMVTRSDGSWLADGFAPGQTVRFRGTAKNNVHAAITVLTETVMSVDGGLADEGPVSGCSVTVSVAANGTKVWFQGDNDPAHGEAV